MSSSFQLRPWFVVGTFAVTLGALAGGLAACGGDDSSSGAEDIASIADPKVRGQKYVEKNDCAQCHGAPDGTLSGQDKAQPETMAYGANLTPDVATGIGSWSDDQIKAAIKTGVDDEGKMLCPTMKRFTALSDAQLSDIVTYLRSLAPVSHENKESTCN